MADAVVTASPVARLTGINAAAEQLFGWKSSDLIGLPIITVTRS